METKHPMCWLLYRHWSNVDLSFLLPHLWLQVPVGQRHRFGGVNRRFKYLTQCSVEVWPWVWIFSSSKMERIEVANLHALRCDRWCRIVIHLVFFCCVHIPSLWRSGSIKGAKSMDLKDMMPEATERLGFFVHSLASLIGSSALSSAKKGKHRQRQIKLNANNDKKKGNTTQTIQEQMCTKKENGDNDKKHSV